MLHRLHSFWLECAHRHVHDVDVRSQHEPLQGRSTVSHLQTQMMQVPRLPVGQCLTALEQKLEHLTELRLQLRSQMIQPLP